MSSEPPRPAVVFLPFVAPATSEFNRLDNALPVLPAAVVVRSDSPDRLGDPIPASRFASTPPGDNGVPEGDDAPCAVEATPMGRLILGRCSSGAWRAAWSNCSTPACAAARSRSANDDAPENMVVWVSWTVWGEETVVMSMR